IARGSFDKPVRGLDTFPAADQPPVNITHVAFQSMVGIGSLLMLAVVVYWLARWRGRDLRDNRWFLRFAVLAGPLAVVALESGWVATEVGRQPWTVWQVLRTADAATDNPGLWWSYAGACVVYLGLTVGAYAVLRSMSRRWRAGQEDLPSPYGPQREDT
ncbi:MAG: cytochrome ubiquinol oxidase subunit, partial [Nocardioides sp.]|nr:cytochrome ubiquinol oxidase subunit [Nocardioides sp.]